MVLKLVLKHPFSNLMLLLEFGLYMTLNSWTSWNYNHKINQGKRNNRVSSYLWWRVSLESVCVPWASLQCCLVAWRSSSIVQGYHCTQSCSKGKRTLPTPPTGRGLVLLTSVRNYTMGVRGLRNKIYLTLLILLSKTSSNKPFFSWGYSKLTIISFCYLFKAKEYDKRGKKKFFLWLSTDFLILKWHKSPVLVQYIYITTYRSSHASTSTLVSK